MIKAKLQRKRDAPPAFAVLRASHLMKRKDRVKDDDCLQWGDWINLMHQLWTHDR